MSSRVLALDTLRGLGLHGISKVWQRPGVNWEPMLSQLKPVFVPHWQTFLFFFLLWAELLEFRVTALFFCLSVVQKWQWRSVLVCIINHFLSFSLGLLFCPSAELETCPFSPCKILQIFPRVLGGGMPLRRQHFQLQPAGSNLKGYFGETNTNRMLR